MPRPRASGRASSSPRCAEPHRTPSRAHAPHTRPVRGCVSLFCVSLRRAHRERRFARVRNRNERDWARLSLTARSRSEWRERTCSKGHPNIVCFLARLSLLSPSPRRKRSSACRCPTSTAACTTTTSSARAHTRVSRAPKISLRQNSRESRMGGGDEKRESLENSNGCLWVPPMRTRSARAACARAQIPRTQRACK